jgi:nucleotide-binding universal stress UspA family protein
MQRILVALDGSPSERHILTTAVRIAQRESASLYLFHAVSLPVPLPARALAVSPETLGAMLVDEARAHLTQLAQLAPIALRAHIEVELGVPWRAVCELATRIDAELIVVGSHGYGGIDRLIGTTAAKIVNHAHCSVLVVRPPIA